MFVASMAMIGFLRRFTESLGLKSMPNMYSFANECVHVY